MEKRSSERIPVAFPIRIRIDDIDEFVEKHTSNLSEGGLFVEMNYPPPVGSTVDLEFYLKAVDKTIHAGGEVVRSISEGEANGDPRGIGIRFTSMGKDGKRFVELVIKKFNQRHPSQRLEIPQDLLEELGREIESPSPD